MKRRFRRLERILRELGLDHATRRHDVEARREVQAAMFLLQMKQQLGPGETVADFDLSDQSGYFFKWYGGPYSSRLDETHGQMVSHLRYERKKNGSFKESEFANTLLVQSASEMRQSILSPPGESLGTPREQSLWMRTLATTAYCLAGGWDFHETRQKVSGALGDQWDSFVDDAIRCLDEFELLEADDYLMENRTRVPA